MKLIMMKALFLKQSIMIWNNNHCAVRHLMMVDINSPYIVPSHTGRDIRSSQGFASI